MTQPQTEETVTMAQQAMVEYDEQGEAAFIVMLGQLAHPAQTNETWQDAGVCVLADGSAVVQGFEHYEFRWEQKDGRTHSARSASLPKDDRRIRWFYHGPLSHYPAGDSVWQDVDEILTERALDLLHDRGVSIDHLTDGDRSKIPMVTFMKACPQVGALMDAAFEPEPKLPEWIAGAISDHVRGMSYAVVDNLHEDDLAKAVEAVAAHIASTVPENC